jgi:hypothetical protein
LRKQTFTDQRSRADDLRVNARCYLDRMSRNRQLSTNQLDALIPYAPMVGATEVYVAEFPAAFGSARIQPREPERNEFHGLTVSHPTSGLIAFGLAYTDLVDGRPDEDIYALDVEQSRITYHRPGEWEKMQPGYVDTHHSDKPYFKL